LIQVQGPGFRPAKGKPLLRDPPFGKVERLTLMAQADGGTENRRKRLSHLLDPAPSLVLFCLAPAAFNHCSGFGLLCLFILTVFALPNFNDLPPKAGSAPWEGCPPVIGVYFQTTFHFPRARVHRQQVPFNGTAPHTRVPPRNSHQPPIPSQVKSPASSNFDSSS